MEKAKKRQAKKLRENEAKQEHRKKMSVIASTTINNDEEMILDKKTWDKLKQIDEAEDIEQYIDAQDESSDSENHDMNLPGMSINRKKLEQMEQEDLKIKYDEDEDSDDNVARINRMQQEIDMTLAQKKEYSMTLDKKEAKKDRKNKAMVDLQRQRR